MPGPWTGGPPPFVPFIGGLMFFVFLLTVAALFFLVRRGTFGPPPWAHSLANRAPEAEAKKILADRFAQGDIDAEEFMERAAVLNWTPGAEQYAAPYTPPGKKKRR